MTSATGSRRAWWWAEPESPGCNCPLVDCSTASQALILDSFRLGWQWCGLGPGLAVHPSGPTQTQAAWSSAVSQCSQAASAQCSTTSMARPALANHSTMARSFVVFGVALFIMWAPYQPGVTDSEGAPVFLTIQG